MIRSSPVIDFLQVRIGAVHILDYKPDTRTNRPFAQLTIYALALSRLAGLRLAIEEWFQGKLPKLPPLEHLPSAAFSTAKRRSTTAPRPSADQPQLPLPIAGGRSAPGRHLNPIMVTPSGEEAQKPAA